MRFFHAINMSLYLFFFFQAEDGIRDIGVTGVQTCALPISPSPRSRQHLDPLMPAAPHVTHRVGPNVSPKLLERRASNQTSCASGRRASLHRLRSSRTWTVMA